MKALLTALLSAQLLFGEAGVLIPSDAAAPDETKLSIAEMDIRIRVRNGSARVSIVQIFKNHTGRVMEGSYTFSLPARALISDFAVWDDVVRIPGVVLERRRAEEIYNEARTQMIDPGLLQQGETDATEARRTTVFSAKVLPIPAYGTKRIEIEYEERLPVERLRSFMAVPLRPAAFRALTAGRLSVDLQVDSMHGIKDFTLASKLYPAMLQQTPHRVSGRWEGQKVVLAEDFAFEYSHDAASAGVLRVLAYRDADSEPGFFEASALFPPSKPQERGARTVVALFDASLSMQWDKLERTFAALNRLLHSLTPADNFQLIVFNTDVASPAPTPQRATPQNIEQALEFVRKSPLRGGTDLQKALTAALGHARGKADIVLLTDGGVTRGPDIRSAVIGSWFASARRKQPDAQLYVFAVGDDANIGLLRQLGDVVEWVRSTEPVDFKLDAFLSKLGSKPLEGLSLSSAPAANTQFIYPLEHSVFPGSMQYWVGQYLKPARQTFSVQQMKTSVDLPANAVEHLHLPRAWAKARVDALLARIDREGEDKATIDEIIRLARKYKFVTPYTSFLAAPRSLLRPRVIRPGDPVLRVHTDPSIQSVIALFPFGLVKSLRFLKSEQVWQTRFLAPADLSDGKHSVRLILRDRQGRVHRESKTFLIVSKTPQVKLRLAKMRYRRGEVVELSAGASESARTVVARMYGVAPVDLRWNPRAAANTGSFIVPAHLPAGRYPIRVTAEDFAHNIGTHEVMIEILP